MHFGHNFLQHMAQHNVSNKTLEVGLGRAGADLQEPRLKTNSDLSISIRQTQA